MGAMKWQAQISVQNITDKLACDILIKQNCYLLQMLYTKGTRQMFNSYLSDWLCIWRDRVVGGKKNGGGHNTNEEVLNAEGEAGASNEEAANMWSGSVED